MSVGLVSYDTSDESDEDNDSDDNITTINEVNPKTIDSITDEDHFGHGSSSKRDNDVIADEYRYNGSTELANDMIEDDEYDYISSSSTCMHDKLNEIPLTNDLSIPKILYLPPPSHSKVETTVIIESVAPTTSTPPKEDVFSFPMEERNDVLKGLPEPKQVTSLHLEELDHELEEEVKPKTYDNLVINKSKNKDSDSSGKKKIKQPVKISIPNLIDEDDSGDEEPAKPKIIKSNKSCGLFRVLPSPKQGGIKETNRLLIPYSLKRKIDPKPKVSTNVEIRQPHIEESTIKNDIKPDDDEENDVSDNFFALSDKNDVEIPPSSYIPYDFTKVSPKTSLSNNVMEENTLRGPWPSLTQPSTLFKPKNSISFDDSITKTDVEISQCFDAHNTSSNDSSNVHTFHDEENSDVINPENDAEFVNVFGKRNLPQDLNFIDVKADYSGNHEELLKSLSQEQNRKSFSRKNKNMPSSKERRKHQITYLAFEAKERELDLKNEWSKNKLTKRQTQAKYGF